MYFRGYEPNEVLSTKISMIELNLPKCRLRLEQREGKPYVYDELRRKFVRLTPEEWVRQHFVHYLIDVLGYPQPLMQNEVALRLGETSKRCDTLLYDKALRPQMILEYKAPHVALTETGAAADRPLQLCPARAVPRPEQRPRPSRLPYRLRHDELYLPLRISLL